MAIQICAFNSIEMNDEELVKDGLNFFVNWDLSNTFNDLILRRELVQEYAELDQIARILNITVEPIYAMSFYWDKDAETEHLSYYGNEDDKLKQLYIIEANNKSLLNNINIVQDTMIVMEAKLAEVDSLDKLIVRSNDGFFNNYTYFSKTTNGYSDNFYADIKKMNEFLVFSKSLGGDTTYFKFSTKK